MSEVNKTKRVALTDDQAEFIAGGNIQYVVANGEVYAYGTHNPDKKYGFSSLKKLLKFVDENYDLYGEAGTLDAMVDAGIAWEL